MIPSARGMSISAIARAFALVCFLESSGGNTDRSNPTA
jgi:hypothetical protein